MFKTIDLSQSMSISKLFVKKFKLSYDKTVIRFAIGQSLLKSKSFNTYRKLICKNLNKKY